MQVKETNMAEHCSCAGNFTETLSYDTFIQQMTTFRNIARLDRVSSGNKNLGWKHDKINELGVLNFSIPSSLGHIFLGEFL